MSKMSRRKQSKPQHISNGSDDEDNNTEDSSTLKDAAKDTSTDIKDTSTDIKDKSADNTVDAKSPEPNKLTTRLTRKQAQLLKSAEKEISETKDKNAKETNNNEKPLSETEIEDSEPEDTEATEAIEQDDHHSETTEHDSIDFIESTELIAKADQPMTKEHPRLRDRTCEYCGAVKPTPAALARHLRKHTGERPFVCQGCNKAYKAKRSLQLHQLTYHPELVNKTPPHQASGVSICTSSLLREALESRIKQDLTNYSGPHLDEATGEFVVEDATDSESNHKSEPNQNQKTDIEDKKEPVSMIGALLAKTVDMPTVHKIAFAADGKDEDDDKLSNRTCGICGKVCSKPCDLKRHQLMHSGERPFKCEVCGKCFKAKASMLYHQRAAHNMAVELSQGLEDRYMRLKNRALMKSLYVQDKIIERERALLAAGNGEVDEDDIDDLDHDLSDGNHGNISGKCGLKFNEDFSQSISRQISHNSDTSFMEDESMNDSLENGIEDVSVDDGSFVCNKMRIRNETVIVTRLDGINSINGKEISMFKCYICGQMFSSLSRVQCHLSMHFDREITTYQCKYCDSTFKLKSQMVQHLLKHKIKNDGMDITDSILSDEDDLRVKEEPSSSYSDIISPSSESDKPRSDGSETSPENALKTARFNGAHECKFCRKTFSRQFLLQRHERIHTGQKAFYCKECGKGFSESGNLSQHMNLFHADAKTGTRPSLQGKSRSLLKIACWDKLSNQNQDQDNEENANDDKSAGDLPSGQMRNDEDMERAKELLEKDGIKEEVTVVMPSAPPTSSAEPTTATQTTTEANEKSSGVVEPDENSNSEIMTAPKRSLISFCKDGPPQKSRRKSTLPTKLGNHPPTSIPRGVPPAIGDADIEIKREIDDSEDISITSDSGLGGYNHTAAMIASMNPLLLANHAATSAAGPCLLGAGLVPHLPVSSAAALGGVSSLMNMPISVQVSSAGETITTKSPSSPTQSTSSTSQPSPADHDLLVGCPRVQWNASGSDDPSPPPAYSSERKPLPDWHPLSKLSHIPTHDGRKVTSLSRTHSRAAKFLDYQVAHHRFTPRLHVVNQPVDREQVCKPTILPDGRTVYRCIFCAKDFLSFSDINRHMDFHEDIRPYKCQYCDYYARTNSQLKVHMMRHQGIREFCCKLCNYKGVTQSDLNRHMKSQIHMLKSRNECQKCGEGFVTPKNLEKHLQGGCKPRKSRMVEQSDCEEDL